jgi:hypothetical protein
MADKIMVLDKIEDIVEDGEVVGKLVTDKVGNQLKVKVGRGGHLKKKWDELQLGNAYKFKMGEYKGFPFVEDFESVKDAFVKQAQAKVEDAQVDIKNKSVVLSYAKDIMVAYIGAGRFKSAKPKEIGTNTVLIANEFSNWLMSTDKIVEKIESELK